TDTIPHACIQHFTHDLQTIWCIGQPGGEVGHGTILLSHLDGGALRIAYEISITSGIVLHAFGTVVLCACIGKEEYGCYSGEGPSRAGYEHGPKITSEHGRSREQVFKIFPRSMNNPSLSLFKRSFNDHLKASQGRDEMSRCTFADRKRVHAQGDLS